MRIRDEVLALDVPTFEKPLRSGWIRAYCHVFGAIQWLYAGLFGLNFFCVYPNGQFYNPAYYNAKTCRHAYCINNAYYDANGFHHVYDDGVAFRPAYYDYRWLIDSTATAMLVVAGLLGGYGLVRLRRWVRRPELAYLVVLTAWVTSDLVEELSRRRMTGGFVADQVLFYLVFALPYFPLLSRSFVTLACGPGLPRIPEKAPRDVPAGVWDAALDG